MKRIAVFCSGNGSNFQAIINAQKRGYLKAKLALMVCDNPSAYAIIRANKAKIPVALLESKHFPDRIAYDKCVVSILNKAKIDLVVLAGFMRIISPYFVRAFRNRIINIHPALLPSFKGAHGIKDALDYGAKVTGVTVHFVDEKMDHGAIILQETVDIKNYDTEETLAPRIHKIEHKIYPKAIKFFLEGRLKVNRRKIFVRS